MPKPPTPLGPMAASFEGGPEDDSVAMSLAPPRPWISPGVGKALWYAAGCAVAAGVVYSLPSLAERDPEAAKWAVEVVGGAGAAVRRWGAVAGERAQPVIASVVAAAAALQQCCVGLVGSEPAAAAPAGQAAEASKPAAAAAVAVAAVKAADAAPAVVEDEAAKWATWS